MKTVTSPSPFDEKRSTAQPSSIAWLNFTGFPDLPAVTMNAFGTAPHNEHFWGLHGWIDERLADWQRAHGEAVEQSPLPPSHHLHGLMGIVPAPVEPHTGGDVLRPHWMQPHFLPARGS